MHSTESSCTAGSQKRGSGYLIERFDLEKHCTPPSGERIWDLVLENKVQCAVCGRWLEVLNDSHLRKHNLTQLEYKIMFGAKKKQPFYSRRVCRTLRKHAVKRKLGSNWEDAKIWEKRPYSYKKPLQAVIERIERGLQTKAARSPKPRKLALLLRHRKLILRLRRRKLTFPEIARIVSKKFGMSFSAMTVSRAYRGGR